MPAISFPAGETGATLLTRHRLDRSHPLRVRRQRSRFLALSAARRGRRAAVVAATSQNPVSVRLADETDFKHHGADGFRRQRAQSEDRHDSRPRHFREQGWPADAGIFRPAAAVRRRARMRCWCPTARSRPIRPARSSSRSPMTARSASSGSSLARWWTACGSFARGSRPPTASSSTVCSAPGPGQKVTPEDGKIERRTLK